MKNVRRILNAALVLGAVCLTAASADARSLKEIMDSGTIKIATDMGIPPSGMLDSNLKPTGSDVETAKLLAKDWGLKLEFVETTGATRIPNLQTGKADIVISTLSVTPERAKVIDFSTPYAALKSVVGAPAALDVKDWADLKGKTITVTRGTTQDTHLTRMADEKGFNIKRYDDDATTVTAALSGQAKYVATSATLIQQIGKREPKLAFEPKLLIETFKLAVGVPKDHPELLAKVNEWVSANLKNGKLNDIYEKFHGTPLPASMLK